MWIRAPARLPVAFLIYFIAILFPYYVSLPSYHSLCASSLWQAHKVPIHPCLLFHVGPC